MIFIRSAWKQPYYNESVTAQELKNYNSGNVQVSKILPKQQQLFLKSWVAKRFEIC